MTTSATAVTRGLATVALTGAVLLPVAGFFATSAYADDAAGAPASATPTVDIGEPAYTELTPDPVTGELPASGGWIIGGTLQEGSQAAPAAKPVTVKAPAARPVTVSGPARPAAPAVQSGAPTALPFTGPGRLYVQLTLGAGLVLLGVGLTSAAGAKRAFALSG
jgi:hypothetical protein